MTAKNDALRDPHILWMAGSTATVAGLVNVASVTAFFAFASNVTGHFAVFAQELAAGQFHQVVVIGTWVSMFVLGALLGNLLVALFGRHSRTAGRAAPVVVEVGLLVLVGAYGHLAYRETALETQALVATLLLAMGIHNGTVATVSFGKVKTTHLTGLSTSLGMGLSLLVQGRIKRGSREAFQLKLDFWILGTYLTGGVLGGLSFMSASFLTFLAAATLLAVVLVAELALHYPRPRALGARRATAGWLVSGANEDSTAS